VKQMNSREQQLRLFEQKYEGGITSSELLDAFAGMDVQLSEASLRKYVQLGLLPRSIRVGRKGKHQGSQGVYPVSVLRQILLIKEMMANNFTIEQIQRDFFFMRRDLQQLQQTLTSIFSTLSAVLQERNRRGYAQDVARDVEGARQSSHDLLIRLEDVEKRLTTRAHLRRLSSAS